MKKIVFLCLALLMPVLVYLFLKTFGRNEFDVPVLYTDSVTVPRECQPLTYNVPYVIPDSVLQQVSWNREDSLTLLVFDDTDRVRQHERSIQVTRIFTAFKAEPLQVVKIYTDMNPGSTQVERLNVIGIPEAEYTRLRSCVFLLNPEQDAVLIDRQKRIRGQYNLLKREDADRLIMEELNILFEKY